MIEHLKELYKRLILTQDIMGEGTLCETFKFSTLQNAFLVWGQSAYCTKILPNLEISWNGFQMLPAWFWDMLRTEKNHQTLAQCNDCGRPSVVLHFLQTSSNINHLVIFVVAKLPLTPKVAANPHLGFPLVTLGWSLTLKLLSLCSHPLKTCKQKSYSQASQG